MNKSNKEKDIRMYKESYFMYEKTKNECIERMGEAMNPDGSKKWTQEDIDEKVKMIEQMQSDVKEKFLLSGGDIEELTVKTEPKKSKTRKVISKKETSKDNDKQHVKKVSLLKSKKTELYNDKEVTDKDVDIKPSPVVSDKNVEGVHVISPTWSVSDFSESFDVIPLPSRGQCYEDHNSTIAVSYLTANDENMIVSPNLYRDGLILDYLLRAKIKNKNIDPDDLLEGDRDAIILWLRATGYGTQYPITVTDNKSGVDFDTVVDLTQIKHKPFVLTGDEDGYFDFTLPVSGDKIKFRFLTHGDIKQINEVEKEEQSNVKKDRLTRIVEELSSYIENDNILTKDEKMRLFEAKRNISKWADKIETTNDMGYTHTLTNKIELAIMSVNGNDDREFISEYVERMNVRDALALRRYISENEPGLDFSVMVERPESLGGGSMPVFLSLDEYVFLNIT